MGEAMVTGFLNGGAFLWTFLSSTFLTNVFGFGSKNSSMISMIIIAMLISLSTLSFFFVKMDLKRRRYEEQQNKKDPYKDMTEKTQDDSNR